MEDPLLSFRRFLCSFEIIRERSFTKQKLGGRLELFKILLFVCSFSAISLLYQSNWY